MLWVLKRTEQPKHMLKIVGKKRYTILRCNFLLIWTCEYAIIEPYFKKERLTLSMLAVTLVLCICKQFGPRLGPTFCQS